LIGAVNTILNRRGRLFGYNTDGVGLLEALRTELDFDPAGSHVLLLGAGGACRAAAVALSSAGAQSIGWVNRTAERAQNLADEFSAHFPGTAFAAYSWDFKAPSTFPAVALADIDLVVNTTTLGLKGESIALPWDLLPPRVSVYDMVYASETTPLSEQAALHGYRAADGLSMLVGQGEHAFRIWTGVPAPAGVMKKRLLAVLHHKKQQS
jgi:shikimate dehydrogenase